MPCIRRNETTETKKKLSLGERFAIALELEKKPQVFEAVKGRLRRKALEIFNLKLPIFQQQEKMEEFVKQAIEAFPGFFNEDHKNNKQRLHLLELYGADYMNKSGKMTISESEKPKSRKEKIAAALSVVTTPATTENTIKSERPKPTPLHRGASRISDSSNTSIKSTNGVVTSTPKPNGVHKAGAGSGGGPVQTSAMKKPSEIPRLDSSPVFKLREDGPLNEGALASPSLPPVVSKVVSKKPKPTTVSPIQPPSQIVKKSSSADPNPNISFGRIVRAPSPASSLIVNTPTVVNDNTLTVFLASCLPSMLHRAAAFEAAGVTRAAEIAGMAQWPEEALRTFIEKQNLGQNPLEIQAILLAMLSV
ncbi:hypothetical protein R3P38DRAFT_52939 [Favolaschia claudopus]|uniref:Uncharacterized protein n=1 Tax=Favolaschia claudopus TaxID=2862362 RepID=A0AAW0EGM5_9AGAR